jgi:hypothetical protein
MSEQTQEPMSRTSRIERTYSLGDYKNIKFYDSVTNIPEEVALDENFMNLLRLSQLILIEQSYRQYLDLIENVNYGMNVEAALEALDDMQKSTTNTLKERLTEA